MRVVVPGSVAEVVAVDVLAGVVAFDGVAAPLGVDALSVAAGAVDVSEVDVFAGVLLVVEVVVAESWEEDAFAVLAEPLELADSVGFVELVAGGRSDVGVADDGIDVVVSEVEALAELSVEGGEDVGPSAAAGAAETAPHIMSVIAAKKMTTSRIFTALPHQRNTEIFSFITNELRQFYSISTRSTTRHA